MIQDKMMKRLLLLVVFVLVCVFVKAQKPDKCLVIAHRGASAYAPENTLEAFEKAIAQGADVIETDVHQTLDSVLILMHDRSVDRTTNGKGRIKDLVLEQIRQMRIKGNNSTAIPTLEEAIKMINGRCKLLIEIKKGSDYYPGIEQRIVDLIKKYNAENWIYTIHSFNKKTLMKVNKADSNIVTQKLVVFNFPLVSSATYDKHSPRDDFRNWRGVNIFYPFVTRRTVKKMHKMGKKIFVWTVNKRRTVRRLKRIGVDGIIGNKPDMIKEILVN